MSGGMTSPNGSEWRRSVRQLAAPDPAHYGVRTSGPVPWCPLIAPIIEPLLQLRRYTESELLAALVQSFFTAWIVTDTPKNAIPFDETGSGDLGGVPVDNPKADNASHSPNEYEMGPGTVAHLGKGEDIKFGNPNIPTAGFDTFVKTLCKTHGWCH